MCRYTRENHNSVLGIREYALQHSARFQAVEQDWVEDWISGHKESDKFVHPHDGTADEPTMSLFAFPAEENFSGGLYPLRWIREIQVQNFWHFFSLLQTDLLLSTSAASVLRGFWCFMWLLVVVQQTRTSLGPDNAMPEAHHCKPGACFAGLVDRQAPVEGAAGCCGFCAHKAT